jgi:hypothetical protein
LDSHLKDVSKDKILRCIAHIFWVKLLVKVRFELQSGMVYKNGRSNNLLRL